MPAGAGPSPPIAWKACLAQKPDWYGGAEAMRIAENVLVYQCPCGGWPKNIDMAEALTPEQKDKIKAQNTDREATIDNQATHTQLAFLARAYQATSRRPLAEAFDRGLDFLLRIQYPNGGWPQFPYRPGYYTHITFNDGAMTGVLQVLRKIARQEAPYGFVDRARRDRAAQAVEKGVECILKCQVRVQSQLTVWCAQHDETTLRPAPARSYEKISLSGAESAEVARFLMGLEHPAPRVVEAIQFAAAWFEKVKIKGIRQVEKADPGLPKGRDKIVVADEQAPPLWARFYEIDTFRPIFCGRDGIVKYRLADIEHERRIGYAWYVTSPAELLRRDFPAWQARWAPAKQGQE